MARAEWPLPDPDAPPEALAQPEAMPNDPAYPPSGPDRDCGGQTALFSFTPACATALGPDEADRGVGMAVDRAWLLTRGAPHVVIAVLADGFDAGDADLGRAVLLNAGELPPPRDAGGATGPHDANGDGRFDLFDYTGVTGTAAPALDALVDPRLTGRADRGDANGNGRFDPDDLRRVFANGRDDDGNDLVDDIAGWDFADDDGDVAAIDGAGGGTEAALIVAATTNNGVGRAGICPECRVLPIRVAADGRASADDVASGLALAAASGAAVAVVRADAETRAGWTPVEPPDLWVLHEAGAGPRGFVRDAVESTIVGGYGPDAPPARATTFRALETCGPVRDRTDLRAPSHCDGTAAARVAGVAGLALSYAAQLEPGRRLTPGELAGLLGATRQPALALGRTPPVRSARSLDARAALDALRAGAPVPRATFETPRPGSTVDPDGRLDVAASVTAPPTAAARWRLEVELGPGALGPRTRALAAGRVAAGDTETVRWSGAPVGWFADPVAAPRRAEALEARLRLVVDADGGPSLEVERRAFVHRDLFSWPAFPLELGSPTQAGLRATSDGRIVAAAVDGRIFTVDEQGDVRVVGSAPTSARLSARGAFGRDIGGEVPRSAIRTAPTWFAPSWWFPTVDGDVVLWSPADDETVVQRGSLMPVRPTPRALVRLGGRGASSEARLVGVESSAAASLVPQGPRVPLPGHAGDLAASDRIAWGATRDGWLRIDVGAGRAELTPVDGEADLEEPPSPVLFERDGPRIAAAFPGRPWQLLRPDGSAETTDLPVAWGEDVIAADIDGDGHPDLAGFTIDETVGPSLTAWSLERGAPLDGFPVPLADLPPFAPLAADVDGDRRPELIFASGATQLAAIGRGGTSAPGFPKLVGEPVVAPPIATDVDGDGRIDLFAVTRSGRVFGFRTEGRPSDRPTWPQFRHDDGATANLATRPQAGDPDDGGCRGAPSPTEGALLTLLVGLGALTRGRRRRVAASLPLLVAGGAGCAAPAPAQPSAARAEIHPIDRVLELPAPPGRETPLSGFAVWQGWSMGWRYNHRLNRAGSLLEQTPCRHGGAPRAELCRARLTATAASGSGTDVARIETYFALVAARGVLAASAAREVLLEGLEGEPLAVETDLEIPVDPELAERAVHVVLLSGFDVASLDSADKLHELSIQLGPPTFADGFARVPVGVEAILGCSSLECPPKNRVDVSLLVGATVVGGSAEALAATDVDVAVSYAWDKREELAPAATAVPVPGPPWAPERSVLGVRGFRVRADREMHFVDLALAITSGEPDASGAGSVEPHATLLVRNWRKKMRNARPPMSWFAYRQPGRVQWTADLVRLELPRASIARRRWRTDIAWKGEGRPSLDDDAERARMVHWEVQP